jgi:hypothetical protein
MSTSASIPRSGGVRRLAASVRPKPPAAPTAAPPADAPARFTDGGGPVIASVHLYLVFWGAAWTVTPSPPLNAVVEAARGIVTGPYMSGLAQYRGVGPGTLAGAALATASSPSSPFPYQEVETLLSGLLGSGSLPSPASDPSLLFLVIAPAGVRSSENFAGEHGVFPWRGAPVRYGWLTHDGTLDTLTPILSHELVEAATDPEGDGFTGVQGTCATTDSWCEIGDICEDCADCTGKVGGVKVQAYWSDCDHACIIPGS